MMKCHEAHELLIPHLNNEVTRSERELLQAHLAECESCWRELNALSVAQKHLRIGMAEYATQAQLHDHAWARLQQALRSQRAPTRVQWSGRGITTGFSTLIAAVGAALFVLGGVIAPTVLSNPSATLSPTQPIYPTRTQWVTHSTVVWASDAPQDDFVAQSAEPSNSPQTDIEDLNSRVSNTTNIKSLNSRPAMHDSTGQVNRSPIRISILTDDEGIERLSMVQRPSSLFRKAISTSSLPCRPCIRME